MKTCPGHYCGRLALENGTLSDCGACPRGTRPGVEDFCTPCEGSPEFYDWLYLFFMALGSLLFHVAAIDLTNNVRDGIRSLIFLQLSAIAETVLASLFTLLLVPPLGRLHIASCAVSSLADWYPMLYNPKPDYVNTLHCTQEIAYPFYSMVMIYYAVALVMMLLIRPVLSHFGAQKKGTRSIYAAMYAFPIFVLVQAALGGLLYYSFPYLVLVLSLVSSAVHLSSFENQSCRQLLRSLLLDARSVTLLLAHWLLHGLSLVAITQWREPTLHAPLLALLPLPTIFYLVTVRYTDPENLNRV